MLVPVAGALLLAACVGEGAPVAAPPSLSPATQVEPRTVTLAAAGDILPHRPVVTSARRYAQGTPSEFDFRSEAGSAAFLDAAGVRVAHLAYSYSMLNNWGPKTDVPPEAPWTGRAMWPVVTADGILDDARIARADGADVVVVSMHWGEEYVTEPTLDQRQLAEALLTSGDVDAILGTHVHVVQPCETIDGRPVVYGMGNFLSNQSPRGGDTLSSSTQDGVIVEIAFTVHPAGEVTSELAYRPTIVNLDGHIIEVATEETPPSSYARTVEAMESLGPGACEAIGMAEAEND